MRNLYEQLLNKYVKNAIARQPTEEAIALTERARDNNPVTNEGTKREVLIMLKKFS